MKLSRKTVAAILASRSPFLQMQGSSGVSFTIVCTVEEGIACRFAQADWNNAALSSLAQEIVEQLGWKIVEQSAQRQVVVRCCVPPGDTAATAEIDRGDGFAPLPIDAE